eukprot:jgi/Chrzof1/6020/Cz17g02040.t1
MPENSNTPTLMGDDRKPHYEYLELGDNHDARWRTHYCGCLGNCSAEDCMGCGMAHYLPGCAFGWNVSKVLGLSFWKELGKFVLISTTPLMLYYIFYFGAFFPCVMDAANAKKQATMSGQQQQDDDDVVSYMSSSCKVALIGCVITWYIAALACWVLYGLYVGKRRSQIKARLGVARNDDCCNDCCLHMWCSCCALAQETRTILHLEKTGRFTPQAVAHAAAAEYVRVPVTDDMERAGKASLV